MQGHAFEAGPLLWFIVALLYGSAGLSLYVVADSARRDDVAFRAVPEGRFFYLVPQGVYFVAFVLDHFPSLPLVAYFVWVAFPFAIAHQVAYLLRIVFPTQARREQRLRLLAEKLEETTKECEDESPDDNAAPDSDEPIR